MDRILCAIISQPYFEEVLDEQELWMDLDHKIDVQNFNNIYSIVPLIDHPHSDRENGQEEIHYHVDTRYFGEQEHLRNYKLSTGHTRITKYIYKLDYFNLKKYDDEIKAITKVSLIKNSKLKHKCIHKGKCPHRGFDLTNIAPDKDGVITCPLHGLKFDKDSKKIINR